MNRRAAWMLVMAAFSAAVGCVPYRNMVDPCWPDRYAFTAQREVIESFAPQVQNGHILDQTIWNYDFDKGTDLLNPMGMAKLEYMVRRRPFPDPTVYLATAHDVNYDPNNPESYGLGRRTLDGKRALAVRNYLQAQMVGRPMKFEILIHDPFEVGQSAEAAANSMRQWTAAAQGTIATGGGINAGPGVSTTTQSTTVYQPQGVQQGAQPGMAQGGAAPPPH
jgi:hypothetical protein